MIPVKKIVLSLCLILCGVSILSGCTKDEVLDQYNNIVQSAGSIALTGNSSLQGTKEKGLMIIPDAIQPTMRIFQIQSICLGNFYKARSW